MSLYILSVNLPRVWSGLVHHNRMNAIMLGMQSALKEHGYNSLVARYENDVYITTPDLKELLEQQKELAVVLGYITKDYAYKVWRIRWVHNEYYDDKIITTHENEKQLYKRTKTEFL